MRFEAIPVPKQSLRVRSAQWLQQGREDPFAKYKSEVPVESVKTDASHPGSFVIVAAGISFRAAADSPAAARLLSDALSCAGAVLARLRDRDARGGWNLEVAFFSRRALDFGDIEIETGEAMLLSEGKEEEYVYRPTGSKRIVVGTGDSGDEGWFFIKPYYSWVEDNDLNNLSPEIPRDSFCIVGETHRFIVRKVPRETTGGTSALTAEIFLASKKTEYRHVRDGDRTILLVCGKFTFKSRADAVQSRALAQMQVLVQNDGSYLRNWDMYNEKECAIQLAKARAIGAIRYGGIRPISNVLGDESGETSVLSLLELADEVRDKFSERNLRLELQFVRELPEWLAKPDLTGAQLIDNMCQTDAACAVHGSARAWEGKDDAQKPETIEIKEWSFDRNCDELEVSVPAELIPNNGYVVVSLTGFLRSFRRREEARRRIVACAGANPNLGTILESHGIPEPLEKRRRVEPLSAHSRLLFQYGATDRQIEAIDVALNTPDIALIQGPPGTGKTTVITAVLDRLNELAIKSKSAKASVLLCGFQHDAVENMIGRIKINSLPVPKFGRRHGDNGESAESLGTDAARLQREWCECLAATIRKMNPQLVEAQGEHAFRDLVIQYMSSPSLEVAKNLCQAILDMPVGDISVDCRERAREALDRIENRVSSLDVEAASDILKAVRSLRTTERGFRDDGPERAADLLDECGQELDDDERDVLRRASDWLDGDVLDFLPRLRGIKRAQLIRLSVPPVFWVEKHLYYVRSLARDALASIRETGMSSRDRRTAALLEFVESLEGDPEGMLDAVSEYSFAIAATCQQCANWKVAEVKGVKRNGKDDTREVPPLVYDYVIIDEAARAQPLDLLIPMSQGKRILLVGDHRQLSQMVDDELAEKLERGASAEEISDLEDDKWWKESMFEYLFTKRIPELEKRDGVKRTVTLNAQFRMHPDLGKFISDNFYRRHSEGEAFDSPVAGVKYGHTLPVRGGGPALWIDVPVNRGVSARRNGSRARDVECDVIVRRLKKWMDSEAGKGLTFGVISFYRGQVENLKTSLSGRIDGRRLHVGTVDSFQGKEFDVVFLSLVRTSEFIGKSHPYGFLTVYNRLNVAMSRQKRLLVVVGDATFFSNDLAEEQVPGLHAFLQLCRSMNAVEEA